MTGSSTIAPLIDANMGLQYRTSTPSEAVCLSIAVAMHALLLFLWNPIVLKGSFEKPQNPLVEIGIVDEAGPAPVEPPKKLSLMDTLKDMLTKPEAPHIEAPTPKTMPIHTPLLQDRSMPRPIMNAFHAQTPEELAISKSPMPISTQKNFKLPDAAPSLQSRSFSGVRAKDLPFETSNETIATAGQAIPIAVGNNSSKAALSYVNPSLRDNSRKSLQSKRFLGSTSAEPQGLNAAATAIQLPSNPSIAPTNNAPTLQETHNSGGGLINRALLGGHTATAALQTIPNTAAQTDQLMDTSANASPMKKSKNGFEIEGKLANRPILKKVIPQYPSWAEEQGIIGTLRLYFTVTPEGTIRSNIKVTRATGNPQLDQVGIDALKGWLFAPQPGSEDDVQWGIITFTFSLGS